MPAAAVRGLRLRGARYRQRGQAALTLLDLASPGRPSRRVLLIGRHARHEPAHFPARDRPGRGGDDRWDRPRPPGHWGQLVGARPAAAGDHRRRDAAGPRGRGRAGRPAPGRRPPPAGNLGTPTGGRRRSRGLPRAVSAARSTGPPSGVGPDRSPGAPTVTRLPSSARRRANVGALNGRARSAASGRFTGRGLDVDGTGHRAGNEVVPLASDHRAGSVTQRTPVATVDVGRFASRTDDERELTLGAGQLGPGGVGDASASIAYRSHGSAVDRAEIYADGRGRERAEAAMSRARHASRVPVSPPAWTRSASS